MWKRVLVICVICTALSVAQQTIKLDDALIYARYIKNALDGHGLVFNAGERVNALTSPLMGYLLLVFSWLLHGRVLLAEMILSTVFLASACSLAEAMVPYSGMILASTAFFYTCFGMETALFLLMLTLCLFLYVKERYFWLPLACTLMTLTRFEGGLFACILLCRIWQEHRIPPLRSFVAPALIAGSYCAFNLSYYGRLLPSSTIAKILHGKSGYWGSHAFFHLNPQIYDKFLYSAFIVPAAIILAVLATRQLKGSRYNKSILPFLAGLFAFYALLNIANYFWYVAPFIFFGIFYAVMALPRNQVVKVVLALVIVECTVTGWISLRRDQANQAYIAAARWLSRNTQPDAHVAALETGTISWYTPRYVDDILGLTNPKNAELIAHHDGTSWLEQDKPDYVIIHEKPVFDEAAAANSPNYERMPIPFDGIYIARRLSSEMPKSAATTPRKAEPYVAPRATPISTAALRHSGLLVLAPLQ
jgi:arabinofuranosyltransferase